MTSAVETTPTGRTFASTTGKAETWCCTSAAMALATVSRSPMTLTSVRINSITFMVASCWYDRLPTAAHPNLGGRPDVLGAAVNERVTHQLRGDLRTVRTECGRHQELDSPGTLHAHDRVGPEDPAGQGPYAQGNACIRPGRWPRARERQRSSTRRAFSSARRASTQVANPWTRIQFPLTVP